MRLLTSKSFQIIAASLLITALALLVFMLGCSGKIAPQKIVPANEQQLHAIISDIDGTLTPNVLMYFKARKDAATALQKLSAKGYKIIYVTTRIPLFQSNLKDWLKEEGFPEGPLHVAQTSEQRDAPEKFKAAILNQYRTKGWQLQYAYGDSSTDFIAYNHAGINKEKIFAFRRKGRSDCKPGLFQACLEGWTEYLRYIETQIPDVRWSKL